MNHESIVPLNPVFLQLGPLTIQWYAVFILCGVAIATYLAIREGKKMGIDPEFFSDLVLYGMPLSILGARLYFVILRWDFYAHQSPAAVFRIWEGGLAIHGGIIAAFIFGYIFCRRRKVEPLLVMDIAGVGFLIAQAIGRWGNFMNQEAHGGVVPGATLDAQREFLQSLHLPEFVVNNMFINGAYHHPTFLYESIWNIFGFLIAVFILRKISKLFIGEIAAFYGIWYSVGRFFIEGLRTDSLMLTENIMMAQFISIVSIVALLVAVILRRQKKINLTTYQSFYQPKSTKNKQPLNVNKKLSKS